MSYQGHVENGVIMLDEPAELPEGTLVRIEPVVRRRTLAEQFADIIGTVPELPTDMAEHHDHYVHGTPKS